MMDGFTKYKRKHDFDVEYGVNKWRSFVTAAIILNKPKTFEEFIFEVLFNFYRIFEHFLERGCIHTYSIIIHLTNPDH